MLYYKLFYITVFSQKQIGILMQNIFKVESSDVCVIHTVYFRSFSHFAMCRCAKLKENYLK